MSWEFVAATTEACFRCGEEKESFLEMEQGFGVGIISELQSRYARKVTRGKKEPFKRRESDSVHCSALEVNAL
jgi:hypothetical protein